MQRAVVLEVGLQEIRVAERVMLVATECVSKVSLLCWLERQRWAAASTK